MMFLRHLSSQVSVTMTAIPQTFFFVSLKLQLASLFSAPPVLLRSVLRGAPGLFLVDHWYPIQYKQGLEAEQLNVGSLGGRVEGKVKNKL